MGESWAKQVHIRPTAPRQVAIDGNNIKKVTMESTEKALKVIQNRKQMADADTKHAIFSFIRIYLLIATTFRLVKHMKELLL